MFTQFIGTYYYKLWKYCALALGWQEAFDDEDGTLVVFNEQLAIHYTGPHAWQAAVLHRLSSQRCD